MKVKFLLFTAAIIALSVPTSSKDTEMRINHGEFEVEGQKFLVEKVIAHPFGGASVEFIPNERGGWYQVTQPPELGRRIHRQVR